MCQLSETDERWTSLGISHDERIMTAIAKQSNGKMQREIFVNLLTPKLAITFRAHKCAMMTERAGAFSGPRCVCTRAWLVDTLNCLSFVDPSAIELTSLALKVQTT